MSDTPITIPEIKRLIWIEIGGRWDNGKPVDGNTYWLLLAQQHIGWTSDPTLYKYSELLKEVRRMKVTHISSIEDDFKNKVLP